MSSGVSAGQFGRSIANSLIKKYGERKTLKYTAFCMIGLCTAVLLVAIWENPRPWTVDDLEELQLTVHYADVHLFGKRGQYKSVKLVDTKGDEYFLSASGTWGKKTDEIVTAANEAGTVIVWRLRHKRSFSYRDGIGISGLKAGDLYLDPSANLGRRNRARTDNLYIGSFAVIISLGITLYLVYFCKPSKKPLEKSGVDPASASQSKRKSNRR